MTNIDSFCSVFVTIGFEQQCSRDKTTPNCGNITVECGSVLISQCHLKLYALSEEAVFRRFRICLVVLLKYSTKSNDTIL